NLSSLYTYNTIIHYRLCHLKFFLIFFFNDTATTEIYTLSLHDALPICALRPRRRRSAQRVHPRRRGGRPRRGVRPLRADHRAGGDRKSTRLNSSHVAISYAVFCLKKKRKNLRIIRLAQRSLMNNRLLL